MSTPNDLYQWAVFFQWCYRVSLGWVAAYVLGACLLLALDAAGIAWAQRTLRPWVITVTAVGILCSASIAWNVARALGLSPTKRFLILLPAVLPASSLLLLMAWMYLAWSLLRAVHVQIGPFGITRRQMRAIREGFCLACGTHLRTLEGLEDRTCPTCAANYPLSVNMV